MCAGETVGRKILYNGECGMKPKAKHHKAKKAAKKEMKKEEKKK